MAARKLASETLASAFSCSDQLLSGDFGLDDEPEPSSEPLPAPVLRDVDLQPEFGLPPGSCPDGPPSGEIGEP